MIILSYYHTRNRQAVVNELSSCNFVNSGHELTINEKNQVKSPISDISKQITKEVGSEAKIDNEKASFTLGLSEPVGPLSEAEGEALCLREKADELIREAKYEQAVDLMDAAVALVPFSGAECYAMRGTARFFMRQFNKAIIDYSLAIAANDRCYVYWRNRAYGYLALNKKDEALADLIQARLLGDRTVYKLIMKLKFGNLGFGM